MKNKLIAVSLMAGVMLAACSGGDGNSNVSSLRKSEPAQTQAPAPTPQVQVKEVERVVTQMATVIVNQPVEVTRVVQVEVTPQPQIQGFVDAGVCDPYQPQPTVALDQQDIETGVVQRGQWCMDSYNKAVQP